MSQQSVPFLITMVTQEDIKGPCSNSTGTPQVQAGPNPSVKAVTTYCFSPTLSSSFAPSFGICSDIRKIFAVFLLKECIFSVLSEGTERLGSFRSFQNFSCRCPEELHGGTALHPSASYLHTPLLYFLQTPFVCAFPHRQSVSYLNVKKHFPKYSCYLHSFLSLKGPMYCIFSLNAFSVSYNDCHQIYQYFPHYLVVHSQIKTQRRM